jgi:hypothetical protein
METNYEYILSLYDFYSQIDFNTLSKLEIKEKAKNKDGINIFALSNLMHKANKETGENLTDEQQNYITKIINYYKDEKL